MALSSFNFKQHNMKQLTRIFLPVIALATLLFSTTSCNKSNDVTNNPGNPNDFNYGTVTASIAGTNWSAKNVYAVDSSNIIAIIGASDNTASGFPIILMTFPDNSAQGATVNFDITKSSM